MTEFK
jgi:Holliday junction resolvasome RuvABC endonuclease subunit